MLAKYWPVIAGGIIVAVLALTGCGSDSTSVPVSLPGPSSLPPTEGATLPPPTLGSGLTLTEATALTSPSPVSSPPPTSSLILPVLAGTPVPLPNEPITPDNVGRIQQLAIWGKGRIEQLAYSPDGKILAVGTTAGVWLYEARTLKDLRFINTGNFVDSLTFSPDSQSLVVDAGTSTVSIWDITTGKQLNSRRVRDGYHGKIYPSPGKRSVAFSPGGDILAATLDDQKIGLWADQGEKFLHTLILKDDKSKSDLALSPDHKLLALRWGGSSIQLWDISTGTQLYTLEGYESDVTSLAFSPPLSEGSSEKVLLAASGVGGPVKLWDAHTGMIIRTLDEPYGATTLTFSPDGALLALSFFDNTSNNTLIQLWQVADGTLLHTLAGHTGVVSSLTFSSDNKILISGSWDGTVRRWDIATGLLINTLEGFINIDEFASRSPAASLPVFLSDNKMFISNPFNHQIELWDLKAGQEVKTLGGHKSLITNLVLSREGNKLVSAERWTRAIQIWDPITGQNLGSYDIYVDAGYNKTLAISFDGQLIASGEDRGGLAVYNSIQFDKPKYYFSERSGDYPPVFSPDGEKMAWISGPTTVTVSKSRTGESLYTLEIGMVGGGLVFSSDSRVLVTGTEIGTIQFWNTDTGELLDTWQSSNPNKIASLTYSPDGRILAAGMKDAQMPIGALTPTIGLWEVKTGKLLKTIEGYQANLVQLAFSPDGGLLASASLDGTMRLWGIPAD